MRRDVATNQTTNAVLDDNEYVEQAERGGHDEHGARTISSPPDAGGSSSRDVRRAEGVQSRDRQPAVANAGPPSCAIERYRIFDFKALSGGNRRFRSTMEMQKLLVFYTLASLGIQFFEPGGQGFESLRAHSLSKDATFWSAVLFKGTCAIQTCLSSQ
jgi:hypothetical protein